MLCVVPYCESQELISQSSISICCIVNGTYGIMVLQENVTLSVYIYNYSYIVVQQGKLFSATFHRFQPIVICHNLFGVYKNVAILQK